MRVAYFVNQYPKVSHTFIRREIDALERQGTSVLRMALRGWDAEVTDPADVREREKTRYVLRAGLPLLAIRAVKRFVRNPVAAWQALKLATKMSRQSERSWPWHLVYLLEASQVADWMEEGCYRHVHAHFGTNSAEVVLLARALSGVSYSFTAHGPEEFDKPISIHLGDKIKRAAFVVAISSFGRSQLSRWVDATEWPKIKVVHCGLEEDFFVEGGAVVAADVPRLVCVGRLCEQKGQLLLIEAAARLARANVAFELVLAGDGEMRAQIESAIAGFGLTQRVRITGWISSVQVKAELLAARALVLPSFAEGLPVVIMEAMALGRPVISTYVAGIPELVRNGVEGWLVPAGDVDALADAMRRCLESSREDLTRFGLAAFRRAGERHRADVEAGRLRAHFVDALGDRA